jgi:hypothetical protein
MKLDPRSFAALVAVLVLAVAGVASAEEIALKPRYQPGDSYVLSLQTTTQTAVRSKSARRKPFDEDVQLEYGARVVVLEIDAHGRPVRERHEEVRLAFARPGEAGSLFAEHAAFEVRRGGDGEIRLFANEKRVERAVEKIVADLLASQFEYSLGPVLFDPGHPVAIGESWELDRSVARRFLRERGMRVVEFEGPATATLEQQAGAEPALVIRYRIAIGRWQPDETPPNSLIAASEAHVEGEVQLASGPNGQPMRHASKLAMRVNGVLTASGVAAPVPWSFQTSQSSEQSTQIVKKALAANF